MKKLLIGILIISSLGIKAQNSGLINYSSREDLTMNDSFLLEEHRLFPTGVEFSEGNYLVDAGTRWVDLKILRQEIVSTTANSQGLVDHWEIHDVKRPEGKNRIILQVRYLTNRWPYNYRAGKLGTIILNHDSENVLGSITFFIGDQGYSGSGETLYTYNFDQKIKTSSDIERTAPKELETEPSLDSYRNAMYNFCFAYPTDFFEEMVKSGNSDGARFISKELEVFVFGSNNISNSSLLEEFLNDKTDYNETGGRILLEDNTQEYYLYTGIDQNNLLYFKKVCWTTSQLLTIIIKFKEITVSETFNEARFEELIQIASDMQGMFYSCN